MWVETFTSTGFRTCASISAIADSREVGLWKRRACCSQRSHIAISSDAECSGRVCAAAAAVAEGCVLWLNALNRLNQAGAEQRNQHQVNAVQASVDSAITSPDDSALAPEQPTQKAISHVRVPGCREARAEAAVERVVGVL